MWIQIWYDPILESLNTRLLLVWFLNALTIWLPGIYEFSVWYSDAIDISLLSYCDHLNTNFNWYLDPHCFIGLLNLCMPTLKTSARYKVFWKTYMYIIVFKFNVPPSKHKRQPSYFNCIKFCWFQTTECLFMNTDATWFHGFQKIAFLFTKCNNAFAYVPLIGVGF